MFAGSLGRANKLGASGTLSQGRCSACNRQYSPSLMRIDFCAFNWPNIGLLIHTGKPKRVKIFREHFLQ
jgi:hypothetical protein